MAPAMKFWNERSLFAVLLRSPWWVSLAVGGGVFVLLRQFLGDSFAAFGALPFLVISSVVVWRGLRAPSAKRIAARVEALRALSQEEFAAALEAAYRREGYEVSRFGGPQADLELTRAGRTSLVAFRRWKAKQTGLEPLREIHAAARARKADECIVIAPGEITDQARTLARDKNIRLLGEAELAKLLPHSSA